MSVATKNPFALLDEESFSPPAVPTEVAPAPAPAATRGAQKTRGGPASRGGKYYARGGKPQTKDSSPAEDPAAESQRKVEGAREGGRGRGRGRGGAGRGGRGRPFDRHSQTGKTDSDKKIHQSWGGDDGNTEFKAEQAATVDAAAEVTGNEWGADTSAAADWGAPAADASADAWGAPPAADAAPAEADKPESRPRREREPEEEDNTLTFDQYLAQQKEKESVIPKLEGPRKANDGAEEIWKDAVPLTKNEEEDAYFVGKTKAAPKARAKKEEKVFLEIDARFERPDRGGRGRGRGGDRARGAGRGGRGGPRGGRQNGAAAVVNVDDQSAFPSLS
ncbi:unnamed protein product [Cyclocybe aegerita]|uniref:Hyaluronan/mRNA-binding protein domain-containing protein n=1 Tax=Cyclocybe aegerita TaxID=1973307 RepID=A0A8S0WN74_CYCAE|nr:unnamed protein product [Cyclocybe aegerita]